MKKILLILGVFTLIYSSPVTFASISTDGETITINDDKDHKCTKKCDKSKCLKAENDSKSNSAQCTKAERKSCCKKGSKKNCCKKAD